MSEPPVICRPIRWFYLSGSVIADQQGLKIREGIYVDDYLKRKTIAWGDIRDFYLELPPEGIKSDEPRVFIEHSGGKQMLPLKLNNQSALLERIEAKALCSLTRKFEFRETRDLVNKPQVFNYDKHNVLLIILRAVGIWLVTAIALFIHSIITNGLSRTITSYSTFPLAQFASLLIICAFESVRLLITIPRIKLEQKFANQQIIVSKTSITWQEGANKIEIPWREVKTYYFEPVSGTIKEPLCIIESARERISFFSTIQKNRVLQLIIKENAKNADVQSWQYQSGYNEEVLGPQLYNDKDGTQIFHYKTATNLVCLSLITIFVALTALNVASSIATPSTSLSSILINTSLNVGPFFLAAIYCWLSYFFSRAETDNEGIRYINLLGQKFIKWDEIQRIKVGPLYLIDGHDKKIRVYRCTANQPKFEEIIEQRSGKIWERMH